VPSSVVLLDESDPRRRDGGQEPDALSVLDAELLAEAPRHVDRA